MIIVKRNNTKAKNRIDHVSIANCRGYNASNLIRFFFNLRRGEKRRRGGGGGGDLRFAASPPTLKTSKIGRERGFYGFGECVCVGGGGRRRRVISAFRFYYLQIYISNIMIIYLHLEVFVLHL